MNETKNEITPGLASLRHSRGITQEALAYHGNMTPVAIHRYEQHLYAKPSLQYLAALSDLTGVGVPRLAEIYRAGRAEQIDITIRRFKKIAEQPGRIQGLKMLCEAYRGHPYKIFRQELLAAVGEPPSDIRWCILTCFHPAQLDRFEKVGKRIPAVQRELLVKAGFGPLVVDLNRAIKEYQGG